MHFFKVVKVRNPRLTAGFQKCVVESIDIENPQYPKTIPVEFYTMKEILDKYPKHYFDKHGNLCLCNKYGIFENHLAPAHFADLGTIQHISKECGFYLEKTFIKEEFRDR